MLASKILSLVCIMLLHSLRINHGYFYLIDLLDLTFILLWRPYRSTLGRWTDEQMAIVFLVTLILFLLQNMWRIQGATGSHDPSNSFKIFSLIPSTVNQ